MENTELVEVLRKTTGEYAGPATWVECQDGTQPVVKWDGDEKVSYVPPAVTYRICHSSGMSDTRRGQWQVAKLLKIQKLFDGAVTPHKEKLFADTYY